MSTITASITVPARPRTASATPAPIRLTRRGRLVLVLSVMLLAVIGGLTFGHGSSQAASRGSAPVQHTVVVAAGESLWSVASQVAPHQDPRLVVADIESLNHLSTASIQVGEQLLVPTFS